MRKGFLIGRAILGMIFALVFFISLMKSSEILAQKSTDLASVISRGYEALEEWRYWEAEELAAEVQEKLEQEDNPVRQAQAYLFLAQYWFYLGDYPRAVEEMQRINDLNLKPDSQLSRFQERIEHLSDLFQTAKEISSEHFRFRYVDPRDQVLAKPALNVLEQAYIALSKDFNHTPKGDKILVEIYPKPSDLAIAVGLEEKMLKDSGTIAICKYRRLMLTSPRALLFGYDYLTTMSHELVHFFVYSLSGEAVPIWLHEGLAKYEELSYKGKAGNLNPVQKSLLASAIKNNELITFAQMHPTFAQFKSPKQGQLAFAEVSTMVDYLKQKCGSDSWFRMMELLQKGLNDQQAIKTVCQKDFPAIWTDWQKWVLAKNWQVIPNAVVMKLEFKEQEGKEEEEVEIGIEKGKPWEFVRLGDLLRDREYYQASVVEYKKALSLEPYDPKIMNKVGFAQVLAKDYQSAITILKKSAEIYPDYSTTYVYLGDAYKMAGDDQNAILSYETALELNPFNPIPYNNLIGLYLKTGEKVKAQEMQTNLNIIKKSGR